MSHATPPLPSRWSLRAFDPAVAQGLSGSLGFLPLTGRVLAARSLGGTEEVRAFLKPALKDLPAPGLLPGLNEAVDRIAGAIRDGRRILVYGDYDADGVTATAILHGTLSALGADTRWHIPCRFREGYGLREEVLRQAREDGVELVVTVDNGISAHREVEAARGFGLEVVVTDHHTPPPGPIVPAAAVVHPRLVDSLGPDAWLSGAGVAFKLAWGLAERLDGKPAGTEAGELRRRVVSERMRGQLMDAVALAAIGTVADVVPLRGSNRAIVAAGLAMLARSARPGIAALRAAARLDGKAISAGDVAFRIAPRVNAAGRMGAASRALELLLCEDPARAEQLVEELEQDNRRRRTTEQDILQLVDAQLETLALDDTPFCVLAGEGWHRGVIGLAAARLAGRLGRPVALVCLEGDLGRGSARSVPAVDIMELLGEASEHLAGFGGHAAAAGFSVARESLPALRESLKRSAAGRWPGVVRWETPHELDAVCALSELDERLVRELETLAPFGHGNPQPLLASLGVEVAGRPRVVGKEGEHLQFRVKSGTAGLKAIAFGRADLASRLEGARCHLAYRPTMNEWNGERRVEIQVEDVELLS